MMEDEKFGYKKLTDWRKQTTYRMVIFTTINIILLIILSLYVVNHFENQAMHSDSARIIVYTLLGIMAFVIIMTAYNGYRLRNQQTDTSTEMIKSSIDLSRRVAQLQVAAEIARDVSGTLDLDRILNSAVNLVRERFGFYHAGIFLIDDEGQYAILRAASGPTSQAMLENKHRLKVGEQGVVGYVTNFGTARIAHDVKQDTRHYKNPELIETRAEVAIPLKTGNRIIGALDVQSTQENIFDDADIEILQTLADLLAIAIDKANLHEKVQQYAQDLEKRVEERTQELVLERGQLQAILDSMGEGVIYTNQNGDIQYVNQALASNLNYQSVNKQIIATLQEYIDNDLQIITSSVIETIENRHVWRGEYLFTLGETGNTFHAGITCTAVFGDDDNYQGIVTVLRDVSKEKELQEQKMRFVANASHELRTPVTNFMTHLYLIRNQPTHFTQHLNTLTTIAKNMKQLIEDLLDMSYFEYGTTQLNKQNHIIQELIMPIINIQKAEANNKNIILQTQFPEDPIVCNIDENRMAQVITNLVTNAIRYTPNNGRITVSIDTEDQFITIGVKDTGEGIAQEHIKQLFQPFFRVTKDKLGTGLGLSITKTIIEQHNAEIMVESILSEGSHFKIRLPKHD